MKTGKGSQARRPFGTGKVFALYAQAKKKGLTIQKNIFSLGYTVLLPSGTNYPAQSIEDLRDFIKGY